MSRLFKTEAEKEKAFEMSREKFFEESRFDAEKPRLGLFSVPGTLAISDNTIGQHHIPEREEDGRVKLGPTNFITSGPKSGKGNEVYFNRAKFASIGNKYADPAKPAIKYQNEKDARAQAMHEKPFRSTGRLKHSYMPYEYMSDNVPVKINRRIAPGEVRTDPKKIYTTPAKYGNPGQYPKTTLGEKIEHLPDEYDRIKKVDLFEAKVHRSKMQENAFVLNSHGNRPFSSHKRTYGFEGPVPPVKLQRAKTATGLHEQPFKPNNPAKKCLADKSIGKFPEYKGDPLKVVTRAPVTDEEKPPSWKVTYRSQTRPNSSVVSMRRNVRREAFKSFKRF